MLWKILCRFMLTNIQFLRNCFYFLRITWRSVILLMCPALRIVVRNSKGNIWKSICRMTVQIGPSLAHSVLKKSCGVAWRFVATLDLLSFGRKKGLQLTLLWYTYGANLSHFEISSNPLLLFSWLIIICSSLCSDKRSQNTHYEVCCQFDALTLQHLLPIPMIW